MAFALRTRMSIVLCAVSFVGASVLSAYPAQAAPVTSPAPARHSASASDRGPKSIPPKPLAGLSVTSVGARSVALSWERPRAAGVHDFLLRRSVGSVAPGSPAEGTFVVRLDAGRTRYVDSGLQPGTTYSYSIFVAGAAHQWSSGVSTSATTGSGEKATGVSGQVTDANGQPLNDVYVIVQRGTDYWSFGTTGRNGQYTITGLAPGEVTVCFRASAKTVGPSPTGYFGACYQNQPFNYFGGGQLVTIRAGKITHGISSALSVGGAMSGRVTDVDGNPLAGVDVYASGGSSPDGTAAHVSTAADGTYRILGLEAASYHVCFDPRAVAGPAPTGYLYRCLNDSPPYQQPGPVDVVAGSSTSGVDIALAVGGAIAGTLLDDTGAVVAGAFVYSNSAQGFSANATTDAAGHYALRGLAPGSDQVCFDGTTLVTGSAPFGYALTCIGDMFTGGVDVATGVTTPLDAVAPVAGAIIGRVTGPDGSPIENVDVQAWTPTASWFWDTGTAADGTFRVVGVPPGDVGVCFDASYAVGDFVSECFDHQPIGDGTGNPVTVTGGETTTVDEQLSAGVAISGTVTDVAGTPIGDVSVNVTEGSGYVVAYGWTGSDGTYTLRGLAQGTYGVCFQTFSVTGSAPFGYVPECYDDQPNFSPTPVVAGPDGASGIDAVLADAGAVSGTVTDTGGAAIAGVWVSAFSDSGQSGSALTADDGSYQLTGVGTGSYTVCFQSVGLTGSGTGYVDTCYGGSATPTPVAVTGDANTPGIDVQLEAAGAISGTVTDTAGNPIGAVWVTAYDDAGNSAGSGAATAADGTYTVNGLAAGSYRVCFQPSFDIDQPAAYVPECFDGASHLDGSQPVVVTAGEAVSGIDAALADAPPTGP